ncbi:MAG: phosphotransferase family protein [Novosphingobium sp.]
MQDRIALRARPTDQWIAELRERYPAEASIDEALTRKLKRRGQPAYHSPSFEEIGERLHRLISAGTEGDIAIRNLRSLTGGASKEQFVFELDWIDGGVRRTGDRMVLRCEPAASIVETDRRREFELMSFAGPLMPVPRVHWIDDDGSVMGTPALVSSFVAGVQKPSKVSSNVTGMGTHFPKALRDLLVPQYARYMAALHKAPIADGDLPSFSRPAVGTTEAAEQIVNWWGRCWQEDLYEPSVISLMTEDWLRRNAPTLDHLSVVHGDFRTGNFLFEEDTGQITAILDWELGYLGDRHADLAWVVTDLYRTYEDGKPFHCGLFESTDAFVDAYEAAGGLPIDRKKLAWHKVFCTWKQYILSLGCALRAGDGLTHQDVLLSWLSAGGYPIAESLRLQLKAAE